MLFGIPPSVRDFALKLIIIARTSKVASNVQYGSPIGDTLPDQPIQKQGNQISLHNIDSCTLDRQKREGDLQLHIQNFSAFIQGTHSMNSKPAHIRQLTWRLRATPLIHSDYTFIQLTLTVNAQLPSKLKHSAWSCITKHCVKVREADGSYIPLESIRRHFWSKGKVQWVCTPTTMYLRQFLEDDTLTLKCHVCCDVQ